jgi:hypothetical protein
MILPEASTPMMAPAANRVARIPMSVMDTPRRSCTSGPRLDHEEYRNPRPKNIENAVMNQVVPA